MTTLEMHTYPLHLCLWWSLCIPGLPSLPEQHHGRNYWTGLRISSLTARQLGPMATAAPAGLRRWRQSAAGLEWWEGTWHVWQPAGEVWRSEHWFQMLTLLCLNLEMCGRVCSCWWVGRGFIICNVFFFSLIYMYLNMFSCSILMCSYHIISYWINLICLMFSSLCLISQVQHL